MRIIKLGHRGSAILLSIFAILFVLTLVVSYMCVVNSEIMITRNHGYGAQAFYIAQTGLEHMLWRLYNRNGDIDDVSSNDTQTFNASADTFSTGTYSYTVTVSEAANADLSLASTGTNPDLSGTDFTREITITLTNLGLSGTAYHSPAPGAAAPLANDGDMATAEQVTGTGIYIDLGSAYTICRVMYRSDDSSFTVETSDNPLLGWTTVNNPYQEPATPASPDNIYVVFDQVQCRYVHLSKGGAGTPWVYEFAIYAAPESYDIAEDFSS